MEDSAIIELYWQRDETAISETEMKYGAFCRALAGNILVSREDAEECVSDTWLSAWNAMPPQRPDYLRSFLGRITRNGALDRLRRRLAQKRGGNEGAALSLEELGDCVPGGDTPERVLEDREIAEVISSWLRGLSEVKRGVFLRRYWYFDDLETIARQFGYTRAKTASLLHRLRLDLRRRLEEEGIVL